MSKVTITVNGRQLQVDPSKMLIEELIAHDVSVPHFCYHEALGVDGNCRMCMVEISGEKRPQIACNTPIQEGMEVSTQSENIMQVKRSVLELELINHPVDCPICDQAGECSLQEYYMEVGLNESRIDIDHKVKKRKHVDLGANVILDQERCVLCARCTRFTANVTHTHDLVISNRGNHACVTTFADTPLEAKGYAMNVVDLCPVGALTSKDFRFAQRVWFLKNDASICHGCSRGCNIYSDHNAPKYEDAKIYRFRPRKNTQVNGHFICDAGRLSYKQLNENRLTLARHKKRSLSIESALKKTAKLFKALQQQTLILISPSLSLEEMLHIQYFASHYKLPLFACEPSSIDSNFADDMLKTSDRASNRASVKLLQINEDEGALQTALKKAQLVLNFSNLDYKDKEDTDKQSWIHFSTHKNEGASMQIPLKAFSEKEGMLINVGGILQQYRSQLKHTFSLYDLSALLAAIAAKTYEEAKIQSLITSRLPLLTPELLRDFPPQGVPLESLR